MRSADPSVVDVTVPVDRRPPTGIRLHRSPVPPAGWALREAIPVTSPERTLIDLAAVLGRESLARAVSAAERARLVDPGALARRIASARGRRGIAMLRELLEGPRPKGRRRSGWEDEFGRRCVASGLPAPQMNAMVGDWEVDALWPDHGVAVELDSYLYHASRRDHDRDRERGLAAARAGIHLLRVSDAGWEADPEEILTTIGRVLATHPPSRRTKSPGQRGGRGQPAT
jgi:hypothetical protein